MKIPSFRENAWELCRRMNQPGDVALAEAAMEFGYKLALRHASERIQKATEELKAFRAKANSPQ